MWQCVAYGLRLASGIGWDQRPHLKWGFSLTSLVLTLIDPHGSGAAECFSIKRIQMIFFVCLFVLF